MLLILVVGVPILGYFLSADWIDPDESTPPPPPPPQLPGELARNAPPAPPSTEGSLGGVWVRALFIVSLLVLVELVLCALVLYVYQLLARSQIAHAAKTLPLEAPARRRGSVVDAVVGAIAPRAAEQSGPDAPASGDSQKPKQASSLPPRVIAPRPINTDPVHVHLDGALAALEAIFFSPPPPTLGQGLTSLFAAPKPRIQYIDGHMTRQPSRHPAIPRRSRGRIFRPLIVAFISLFACSLLTALVTSVLALVID